MDEVVSRVETTVPLSRQVLVAIVRAEIEAARSRARAGGAVAQEEIDAAVERAATELLQPRLGPIINATGVILHTNLGRAPVSDATARTMAEAAANYVPLELDPASGRRGGRMTEISGLMRQLTGAEATLVVNNNAAAVLLFPVAVATAVSTGSDPRPFVVAVTLGASLSFLTPLGYQTNLMVYGIGNYRFSDFARLGIFLNLVSIALALLLIPIVFPF